jgi:hypothetical protein
MATTRQYVPVPSIASLKESNSARFPYKRVAVLLFYVLNIAGWVGLLLASIAIRDPLEIVCDPDTCQYLPLAAPGGGHTKEAASPLYQPCIAVLASKLTGVDNEASCGAMIYNPTTKEVDRHVCLESDLNRYFTCQLHVSTHQSPCNYLYILNKHCRASQVPLEERRRQENYELCMWILLIWMVVVSVGTWCGFTIDKTQIPLTNRHSFLGQVNQIK